MAKVTEVRLVDDIDGSLAVETVQFALGGRDYEIDLSPVNAEKLRSALSDFIAVARRGGRVVDRRVNHAAPRQRIDRERNSVIRGWAESQGFPVAPRGRIPAQVLEAYDNRKEG